MAIAFRSATQVCSDVSATSRTASKPSGVAVGDFLVAVVARSQGSTATSFSSSGWTSAVFWASDNTRAAIGILYKVATSADVSASTYTFTSTGSGTSADQFAVHIMAFTGVNTTTPFAATPVKTDAASANTLGTAPSVTVPSGLPDNAMLICGFQAFLYNATANLYGFSTPSGMTERTDIGGQWLCMALSTELDGAGATGTRSANFITRSNNSNTTPNNAQRTFSFALRPAGPTAVAPTVDAGADAVLNQFQTFTRTATENDGGASISSRAWTIQSGPGAGTTIGTAAALTWEPETPGTYVLRYTATNSQGSGFDELTANVDVVLHPRVAPLRLLSTVDGSPNFSRTVSASPLRLAATRAGSKQAIRSRTAPLKLSGTRFGQKLNVVNARLKLKALLTAQGRPGAGSANARLKLSGTRSGGVHRNSVTRTAPLKVVATRQGQKTAIRLRTAPLRLLATRDGIKQVSRTPSPVLHLYATRLNGIHQTSVTRTANLKLIAAAINRSRTTFPPVPRTALLRLIGTPVATSTRAPQFYYGAMILYGQSVGQRIITELTRPIVTRADNTTKYELVCVARIPQAQGFPVLLEIGPIEWTGLTITEELSQPTSLSAAVKISGLTEEVLQRVRKPAELATELWLYRNGKMMFAGPLMGGNASGGDSLSLEAGDLMTYFSMWGLTRDRVFNAQTEQFDIVTSIINDWQNSAFGHFGIDTSDIPPSGVQRGATYLLKELHKVDKLIEGLRKMDQGFDVDVDPANRRLRLHYPFKGVDRSVGEDAIVFDARNVSSSNVTWSASPMDLASDAYGTATGENDSSYFASKFNDELRTRYGRTLFVQNFDSAKDQATLDGYTQAAVDARSDILLIPGPNARVTTDSDLDSYSVGDKVDYQLHERLTTTGGFRLRKRTITVSQQGQESVSPEFV